jgi:hypothetical protein
MELKHQQNEKQMKVGLRVTGLVHTKESYFKQNSHELIKKSLVYSAIKKSALTAAKK